MAYETFIPKNFRGRALDTIARANSVIEEMDAQGYKLTVRQLYYQFVARGWLENVDTNYKWLAALIDDARKAGLIDWEAIEDRTRVLRGFLYPDDSPGAFIQNNLGSYYEDLWRNQDAYCEVWVEKDALLGVVERAANRWRAPYFACRGYPSSSALYEAGKRFQNKGYEGKTLFLFYLGDHDPSGIDMTRSNDEMLDLFSEAGDTGFDINVVRLALNMEQVRQYNPPPNPTKESDKRSGAYIQRYGEISWELDALSPAVIDRLISDALRDVLDIDQFNTDKAIETQNREKLREVADRWKEIDEHFGWEPGSTDNGDDD